MKSGVTRAAANKRIRQDALREQLSNQGHVQHVVDLVKKVENLSGVDLDTTQVSRVRLAIETRLKLINKYCPDEKPVEISGVLGIGELSDDELTEQLEDLART